MRNFLSGHHTINASLLRAHTAEIGRAGFVASGALALAGFAIEHARPGTFFDFLAPQHLVAAVVLFGGLSLLTQMPHRRSLRSTVILAAVGSIVAFGTFWMAAPFFAPLGDEGRRLATASAFAALLPFFLFRSFGTDDTH